MMMMMMMVMMIIMVRMVMVMSSFTDLMYAYFTAKTLIEIVHPTIGKMRSGFLPNLAYFKHNNLLNASEKNKTTKLTCMAVQNRHMRLGYLYYLASQLGQNGGRLSMTAVWSGCGSMCFPV